ncbi:MAG: methyltransferase domain-containing protein [Rubrivivax sp.]|nr:methyltransferase domain-containing protein [Pyrinomonadaceae bacterium]
MLGHIRSRISGSGGAPPAQAAGGEAAPFDGYTSNLNRIKFVDSLSEADLGELNAILEWRCFVADARGRRFGDIAWQGKRCEPQRVPDLRIEMLHERFDLSDKHVLEIGCFEGVHTVGLSLFARRVTAVDSRIGNVVKTIVRSALFGYHPTVFKCDVEARPLNFEALAADVVHHVGVLYHLRDPAQHLLDLKHFVRTGVMLDTHYAAEDEATETYESGGRTFRYKKYQECGYADPFSGMYDHSKWLLLDDLVSLLEEAGFGSVEIVEKRAERNGPRVLLLARKG